MYLDKRQTYNLTSINVLMQLININTIGGLLSAEAAEFAESFTTSIVIGDDIVGRLSVPAFERFKQKLLHSIQDCKLPKVPLARCIKYIYM